MPAKRVALTVAGLVAGAFAVVIYLVLPHDMALVRSPMHVEAYLRGETPIGSTQSEVVEWLRKHGRDPQITNASVPENSEYPLTRTGGASFIHETVGIYGLGLRTYAEAFYTFGESGRLVDVRVRKTGSTP